jgi:hypothetical protein
MEFTRNEEEDYSGHLLAELYIAPIKLTELFGEPSVNHSDGYKVSAGYTFETERGGEGVEVYDYKETNLYENYNPTPADFWASGYPQRFSVGGTDINVARAFVRWVHEQAI